MLRCAFITAKNEKYKFITSMFTAIMMLSRLEKNIDSSKTTARRKHKQIPHINNNDLQQGWTLAL